MTEKTLMDQLIQKIKTANKFVLSTHRECDGDGLGAELALYYALKKLGKSVRVVHVDAIPAKYQYLGYNSFLEYYKRPHSPLQDIDLTLIFDTNDSRQLGLLYGALKKASHEVIFVDHHPLLKQGPEPTSGSFLDVNAASTGEIVFNIIKKLGISLDKDIARALYTSVAFDTQVFRYVRGSPNSHLIAAELLEFDINPDEIHRKLFSTHTAEKIRFLSKALNQIEYDLDERIAILKIKDDDLLTHGLTLEDTRDIVDMIMNIDTLEAAAIFREAGADTFKVSLRSKGKFEVLSIAEKLGGGGHKWSAGATCTGNFTTLREMTLRCLKDKVLNRKDGSSKK